MFRSIAIILTFFSLWLSGFFSEPSQQFLAFVLIFSVGILHGSNDLSIIAKSGDGSNLKQITYMVGTYIGTVIAASSLFYVLPQVALIVFILLSAYHFGEQHWNCIEWGPRNKSPWFFSLYGLSILLLLFYLNMDETNAVIAALTGISVPPSIAIYGFIATAVVWLAMALNDVLKDPKLLLKLLYELFLVLVFAIVFKTATLIWAFAIYFIYWHSIPSMLEQLKFLYGNASWRAFLRYMRSAGLIWIISLASLLIVYYLIRDKDDIFIPLFFAFLGAITFAHTVIMSKMFHSQNE
ncbi:Brp/Blh family beta-carotene 15,15'-dioxygenase [Aureitalea marina]|uniref:Probable beta-carotene 15,15'-dioxygenase n=1 Tax=Aureitalea marina TaxID=930804 RepID=A0A2S7KNG0_9FLAO|nr:Brp/Blh family beta-carotene 15,15'-dioxygenase [Aureitalea marina]PQB04103.1 hypothetical protein BST85_03695 [Aureitalea marina]